MACRLFFTCCFIFGEDLHKKISIVTKQYEQLFLDSSLDTEGEKSQDGDAFFKRGSGKIRK